MGTAVLGESLASRRVGVMTDDNDGVTSASGLNGSLSLCLTSLSLCSFFFPSLVPLSLSLAGIGMVEVRGA